MVAVVAIFSPCAGCRNAAATQKMIRNGKNGSASRGERRIQKLAKLMVKTAVAMAKK